MREERVMPSRKQKKHETKSEKPQENRRVWIVSRADLFSAFQDDSETNGWPSSVGWYGRARGGKQFLR